MCIDYALPCEVGYNKSHSSTANVRSFHSGPLTSSLDEPHNSNPKSSLFISYLVFDTPCNKLFKSPAPCARSLLRAYSAGDFLFYTSCPLTP
jgi:hypothetical protein